MIDPLKTRIKCLVCEEEFDREQMYPGKLYGDQLRCPYCKSDKSWPVEQMESYKN